MPLGQRNELYRRGSNGVGRKDSKGQGGGVSGGRLCMVKERSSVYVMIVVMVYYQK